MSRQYLDSTITSLKRPDSCHMCRRDRDLLSCIYCPKYDRRNWLEGLESGLFWLIVGLFVLIAIFYGEEIW